MFLLPATPTPLSYLQVSPFVPLLLLLSLGYSKIQSVEKLQFFVVMSTLITLYVAGCSVYGMPFLVKLSSQALTFFILVMCFALAVAPLFIYASTSCWEPDEMPDFLSGHLWHIYFLFCAARLYLDGRTLRFREGYFFVNWKSFTEMHPQIYLLSYLLFAAFLQGNFFILWFW